jgi:predicted dehydrogenase
LTALASGSAEKATEFVAQVPDLKLYDSYDALLADPDIDAVYIPLPNHLHVPWTLRALEAGKHVLVEKPLAMEASGFDAVIEARDASGLLAAEAYMIVFHPQWHKVRDLVARGAIGTLARISAAFTYDNRQDDNNIRNRPDTGGGALPDIGVYIFGAARFVTGQEPEAILSTRIDRENGVDVRSYVTAQFPGVHYSGMVSMRMSPWQEMTFHGDAGVIRLDAPFNAGVYGQARVLLQTPDLQEQVFRFPSDNQYVHQVEAFNASVLDGTAYACPLEFSRGTQAMIDAVLAHPAG